ncbi:MAG TPA: SDR family oxidoreductase [Tepidisphaeraceae bacterium]|jgi:NAD(P)-dependent dehydrogenase (short-subunit alcohol dehydrogenase family)|nr:SDR family oxidoreductase [Tepidisphaeraceae bacterium]
MKRVVAITGVAGGIGRGTARVFYEAGWVVVGIDRKNADDVHDVHRFIHADISDDEAPHHIFETIASKEGRLDALVNNAACQVCKPILETSAEEWDQVFSCNARSVFLSVKQAYPLLKKVGGAIVNVSSVHAVATSCGIAAYAASKGALLALTRAMALEFGPESVRVNAVLPGAVDTPMLHAGLSRGHVQGDSIAKLVRGLGKKHVMGRVGKPHEIGQTILFLADPERSSFMTGQALIVDGGATARLSTE